MEDKRRQRIGEEDLDMVSGGREESEYPNWVKLFVNSLELKCPECGSPCRNMVQDYSGRGVYIIIDHECTKCYHLWTEGYKC